MCLQAASVLQGPAVLGFVVKARFLAGSESDVRHWEHVLASCVRPSGPAVLAMVVLPFWARFG